MFGMSQHPVVLSRENPTFKTAGLNKCFQCIPDPTQSNETSAFYLCDPRANHTSMLTSRKFTNPAETLHPKSYKEAIETGTTKTSVCLFYFQFIMLYAQETEP